MRYAILLLFCLNTYAQSTLSVGAIVGPCIDNDIIKWNSSVSGFRCVTPSPLATGSVILTLATCPSGYSEVTSLDGVTLVGTLAAHGDVGTTGGANNITPTVASLTSAAQTFTGSSANTSSVSGGTPAGTNGTSTVTPLGTNSTSTVTPLGTNGTATAAAQTFTGTPGSCVVNHVHLEQMNTATTGAANGFPALLDPSTSGGPTALGVATGNPTVGGAATCTPAGTNGASSVGAQTFTGSSSTVAAQTFTGSSSTVVAQIFTGSALGTHLHTLTATGTNGTSAVTGTLNSFDNRSAFVKVIFCSKD